MNGAIPLATFTNHIDAIKTNIAFYDNTKNTDIFRILIICGLCYPVAKQKKIMRTELNDDRQCIFKSICKWYTAEYLLYCDNPFMYCNVNSTPQSTCHIVVAHVCNVNSTA